MMYTVSETAKMLGTSAATLRYYEREGLLPLVERTPGGIRMFTDQDIPWLREILFLKQGGMSVKEILCLLVEDRKNSIQEEPL